jgi:hypothetical protein
MGWLELDLGGVGAFSNLGNTLGSISPFLFMTLVTFTKFGFLP